MAADRLAQIEEKAFLWMKHDRMMATVTREFAQQVLALVEIAKAARALMEDVDEIMDEDLRLDALKQKIGAAFLGYGGAWNHEDEFRAALARLAPPAEDRKDSGAISS